MPYIIPEDRQAIDEALKDLTLSTEGELNYAITVLMHKYIKNKGLRYQHLNSVAGVLSCAQAEFYRTVVAPYEDKKIKENGGVSDLDKFGHCGQPKQK